MITNFVVSMIILSLNLASVSLAEDLSQNANNLSQVDPVMGLFSQGSVCRDEDAINDFANHLGFWLPGSSSGAEVGSNELITDTKYDVLVPPQSFVTTNEAYTPGIELRKYVSGIRFGMGRSFGVNFWVWEDLGLGFVLDRGEPILQILNHPSENLLLGPRYRF